MSVIPASSCYWSVCASMLRMVLMRSISSSRGASLDPGYKAERRREGIGKNLSDCNRCRTSLQTCGHSHISAFHRTMLQPVTSSRASARLAMVPQGAVPFLRLSQAP